MSRDKDMSFMGFETWFNNLRMVLKMQVYIFLLLFVIQGAMATVLFFKTFTDEELSVMSAYFKSRITLNDSASASVTIGGKSYSLTYKTISETYRPYVMAYIDKFTGRALWTFLVYLLWIPVSVFFNRRAKAQSEGTFLRGALLASPEKIRRLFKKEPVYLPFGEVKMPVSAETKHALIIGRPGVGKTVCMSALLEKIIARGDRAFIHDFKGDYLQKFYRPEKDVIFNPFDERSVYWNFFDEINSPVDLEAVGRALIPEPQGPGADPFWNNAARDVFTGAVNRLIQTDNKTYDALYDLLTAPPDILGEMLQDTPGSQAGATAIADPESKQTGSVLSVLAQYSKIFLYMRENGEKKEDRRFTIKNWLEKPDPGNIFITNQAAVQDALAPILTLLTDLMGRRLLSLKDDPERRVFFMLDEFGALRKMGTVTSLLTLARSKGGCVFIGIQDLGQIEKIYGREHRQTIVNACGSSAVFAVADSETAEALSKKYGEYTAIESFLTQSMGVDNNRDGISINRQKNREHIIMPSEISSLPDLTFYVQFPGSPVAKTSLVYKKFPDINEPFISRPGNSYQELAKNRADLRPSYSTFHSFEKSVPEKTENTYENRREEIRNEHQKKTTEAAKLWEEELVNGNDSK